MSHNPINSRPDGKALAVLLIIAAVSFGSLFPAVRKDTNRFIESTLDEDKRGGENDEAPCKPEVLHEQSRIESPEVALPTSNGHNVTDGNSDWQSQHIQSDSQAPQIASAHRDLNREKGLKAIRAWEESMINRTEHEGLRNPEACSTISQRNRREATHAFKQATIMREVAWSNGVQAVNTWERAMTNGSRRDQVDRSEVNPLAEESGRLFVWPDARASRLLCFSWCLGDE